MPSASVIVLAYGNRAVTERCLDSLAAALGDELGGAYELVLVDNGSPDDTAELFRAWEDRATVLLLDENRNFAGGCNAGARAAAGDVLVFLNNDTEVPAGALEAVVEAARQPGVGVAGTRLLYPDGTIQHAGVVHKEWQPGRVLPLHLFHHEPGDLPGARASYDLDAVTGACLAMPAPLFEELGGFDEAYVNGLEDIDLCLRARTAGHRVVYRGDVHLVHHERLTRGANHDEKPNAAIFHRRWNPLLSDDSDILGTLFGLGLGPIPPDAGMLPQPGGAQLAVHGRLRSPAPEGFEARALIGALAEAGLDVAARDWFPVWEAPTDGGPQWHALAAAVKRPPHPAAAAIRVATGSLLSLPAGSAAVARIAAVPRGALDVAAVWAAAPALVDELVEGGFPRERAHWLPPAIPQRPPGPGGEGILALFPAHDLDAAALLLEALSGLGDQRIRLLPNVKGALVTAFAAGRLPAAELLDPTSDERALGELAGSADVVCGSDGDGFERRLLLAGAAGAAVVAPAGGAAAAVLGDGVGPTAGAGGLRAALERALADDTSRAARSDLVAMTCGHAAVGARLRELVERLAAARRAPAPLAGASARL
ncbi:MAG: glycosyltransferase family 2 protein [Thermoleophilaceae bacterium]